MVPDKIAYSPFSSKPQWAITLERQVRIAKNFSPQGVGGKVPLFRKTLNGEKISTGAAALASKSAGKCPSAALNSTPGNAGKIVPFTGKCPSAAVSSHQSIPIPSQGRGGMEPLCKRKVLTTVMLDGTASVPPSGQCEALRGGSMSTNQPSLDNIPRNSTWSKKQKRAYSCALSGCTRAEFLKQDVFFITLTSSKDSLAYELGHHWDLLVKRVRRELNYAFEYMKIETSEGNGVIHFLCKGAFDNWEYDAIHAYFSCLWNELHKAPIVWVKPVFSSRGVAGYLTQYLSTQHGFLRRSCSAGWIFPGWRSKMMTLIKNHGFQAGIKQWNMVLCHFSVPKAYKLTALM